MNMERLWDMLVVCAGNCAMKLGCNQACRYQHTFLCSSNLKLKRDNFDLPNQLII